MVPEAAFQDLLGARTRLAQALLDASPQLDTAALTAATQRALNRHLLRARGVDLPAAPVPVPPLLGLPIEAIGTTYERLLSHPLHIEAGVVSTVRRPQNRHRRSAYYTPRHIADAIVERTLSPLLARGAPRALRIVDPSCGAGVFLLAAFARLREHLPGRAILADVLHGVDMDPLAVEVARLCLTLALLAEEPGPLPDLSQTIRVGNALIGTDLDPALHAVARPLDWRQRFDAVIGNPPYDVVEKERGEDVWPHDIVRAYSEQNPAYQPALGGKKNLYRLFLVRSIHLLQKDGMIGMIVPMSLLADATTAPTRRYLLAQLRDLRVDAFPQKDVVARRVFRDAKLSTAVISGQLGAPRGPITVQTFPWDRYTDPPIRCTLSAEELSLLDPGQPIPLTGQDEWALCMRLHRAPGVVRLGEAPGIQISRGEINQSTCRPYISHDPQHHRLLRGAEIAPYRLQPPSQGTQVWLNMQTFSRAVRPGLLARRRRQAAQRRIAVQRITGTDDARRLVALLHEPPALFADSTNAICCTGGQERYLLGLLNSALWQWRFRLTSTNNNVQTGELAAMPYPDRPPEDAQRRAIEALVERAAAGEDVQAQIDAAVCALYGLTASEQLLIA